MHFPREDIERSIPDRFERQVSRFPQRLAVKAGPQELTYDSLNKMSNRIARAIRMLCGDAAQEPVALLIEPGPQALAAILGVLKAGMICVPLDPSFPFSRLDYFVNDSQARVIVTNNHHRDLSATLGGGQLLAVNIDQLDATAGEENADSAGTADSLAFIIYTSGSTGGPKGVMHSHRTVLHRVMHHTNGFGIMPDDRLSLLYSHAYSASLRNIFGALLNGASVFPFDVKEKGFEELKSWLIDNNITMYSSVPTVFQNLVGILKGYEEFPKLRLIYVVGEPIQGNDVEPYRKHFPSECLFVNVLSSNETGSICQYLVTRNSSLDEGPIPVGFAAEDKELQLLDDAGREVGLGEIGEIAVRSRYLSPGYWGQPELTRAAFVPDPGDAEWRVYRTGDLVRRSSSDGCLWHMGRTNQQVKIRGHRVDTAEIERLIARLPVIREVAVVARTDRWGRSTLFAYLVCQHRMQSTITELRSALQTEVPGYMVPTSFVFMDALRRTPNGKIDRQSLPAPDGSRSELDVAFVASETPTEQALEGIWHHLLDVSPIGVHDSFFDLGGHSVTVARLASQIRDTFHVDMPIASMFTARTIAAQSRFITRALADHVELEKSAIPRRKTVSPCPLSFAQQRIWFLDRLEPGSPAYNCPRAYRLRGDLRVDLLQKSLNFIVTRHESLRTTFPSNNGSPLQVITEQRSLDIRLFDLGSLAEAAKSAEAQRIVDEETRRHFDLATDTMLRATLVRLSDMDHILLLVAHHIAFDGSSFSVLLREISSLYRGCVMGEATALPDLPIQYADYAFWQRECLQGETLRRQVSCWKDQLGGQLSGLELPADRPRPAVRSSAGRTHYFEVSSELRESLATISRLQGATLYMTLLAAFKVLLWRHVRQDVIVVGSPMMNLVRAELEGMIGFLANTVVLRTDLSGNPRFCDLLQREREVILGALAHQDLPFEKLVEELHPERDPSHMPLIQVLFAFQQASSQDLTLPAIVAERMEVNTGTAKFDLTLNMSSTSDSLRASFEYSTDLFDRETAARFAARFQILLTGIVANPERQIADLPLLTDAERQQLVVEWNDTAADYPGDLCLHELFEVQAARTPQTVAVVFGQQRLVYRELNARANQLARHLRGLVLEPNTLAAICVERSLDMVVGILGILKAGMAYVPLDPKHPPQRLAFILEDCGAKLLVTERVSADRFQGTACRIVCVDHNGPEIARESVENLASGATSESLAYVIYTSGSTGQPKGVEIPHRAAVNFLHATRERPGLTAADAVLAVTTLSFDIAVLELFLALVTGARVVLASHADATDGARLAQLLDSENITLLQATPATWRLLLDTRWPGRVGLKLLCGGEALPRDLAQELLPLGAELWNMYGPTETTVWSTAEKIESLAGPISLGRPIANTQLYVLDQNRQLVPLGVHGELAIGGHGLARGYRNEPELTADKFVPNPFDSKPQSRLYRTGDLVRWLPAGKLEFLGRIDRQVKLRGFRIELGEIEAALSQHSSLREAAVILEEAARGEKRLVAYVVPRGEEFPTSMQLRDHLRRTLPDYMLPADFIRLERLPLTPSGKIDRRALPAFDCVRQESENTYVAPRTPIEEMLSLIWAKLLGLDRVGTYDNFFEIGGHSLLATQLLSQIQMRTGKDVPLATIFRAQTIAALAEYIEMEHTEAFDLVFPIRREGSKATIVWCGHSGPIESLKELTGHPLYWCEGEGMDGSRPRYETVEEIADHYCRQLAAMGLTGPFLLSGFSFGGLLAFEVARRLSQREATAVSLFLVEPSQPSGSSVTVSSRLAHHYGKLRFTAPRAALSLLIHTTGVLIARLTKGKLLRFYCEARLAAGLKVSVGWRWWYLEPLYMRAIRDYMPEPIQCRLVLIQSRENASRRAIWAGLTTGEFRAHDIGAPSHGATVEDGQFISQWLTLLKRHLEPH